jgi:hypothetical protein
MIKIKIDGKDHNVNPELTVEKYQIISRNPKKYENQTEILALYLGITPDELKDLPVDQISFLDKILTTHMTPPQTDLIFTFKHEGVTYGLENDWGNMTFGQWTDMEVFSQPDKITDNIHILLALLYRPIEKQKGTTYKLEKFKSSKVLERAEIFKNVPIILWFSAANFFFLISKEFVSNTNISLKRKMRIQKIKQKILKWIPLNLPLKWLQDFFTNSRINSRKKI